MDRCKGQKSFVLGVGMLATAVLASQPVMAQDKKLVLRVADQFPLTHYVPRYAIKPWMEQVTKATKGMVQFEHYPAEQLGKAKDLLSLVQSGVADIVLIAPSYVSEKMPLTAVMELPGMVTGACRGNSVYWKLAREGGILAEKEYAPNGVRVLFSAVFPPYQIISAKRKLDGPKDIEGMKLRILGGAMDMTARKLKAIGVKMATPDTMEAISRGTLDGGIFSYGVTVNYKIPAKYVTAGEAFGTAGAIFIISENRWKQFPDSVKKAMTEAGEIAGQNLCAGVDKEEAEDLEKLKQNGVTVVRWSAADKKEIDAVLVSVANEWAAEMDKRGKPGSEVLKAALEARDSR